AANSSNALTGLQFCDTSDDWYQVDLQAGDVFRVDMRHEVSNGNIDMALFDSNQVPLVTANTTTDNEELTYTVPGGGAGTYFLRVFSDIGARDQYRLLLYLNGVGPTDPDCPDSFENNDTCAAGAPLTSGTYNLLVCGQTPMGTDDDWFSTTVQPGETLGVEVLYTPAQGKVNLTMVEQDCTTQISTSQTSTGRQELTFTSQKEQTVNYRVFTLASVDSSAYELTTTVTPAPPCADDANEPNDTPATATALQAPRTVLSQFKCEDDDDWYEVSLLENRSGEVYLNYDTGEADLSLAVFSNAAGTQRIGTTVGQGVSFTAPDNATTSTGDADKEVKVWVRVSTGAERARAPYDLLLFGDEDGDGTIEGPADRICPDRFEDNDDFSTNAVASMPELSVGCFDNLRVCHLSLPGNLSDEDNYKVFVPGNAELTVDASFQHARGDITLDLYEADNLGAALSRGTSMTDNEQVTASNSSNVGKDYVLRVMGAGASRFNNDYELCLGLNFLTPCPGSTQNGNTRATAVAQTSQSFSDITLCENTEDWTSYNIGANQRVFFGLEQNTAFGDIDMQLVNSNGTVVVASATSTDNVDFIDTTIATAGTYYLRVFAKGGSFVRNVYDLYVDIGGAATGSYCPDTYERNDNFRSAASLNFTADNQYSDMLACGADEDWYRVNLTANTTYEAKVFFDSAPGLNLDVEFLDSAGTSVKTSTSGGSDELTTYRPTTTGTYYVGVKNVAANAAEGNYYFYFDRENTACASDVFEPNDARGTAKELPVVPGVYELTSCVSLGLTKEDDYYTVTAKNNGNLTITVFADDADVGFFVEHFSFQTNLAPPASTSSNRHTYTWTNVSAGDRFRILVENTGGNGPYYIEIDN
ncbi:MAG: PPC domain-containing protein, partial [Myxococcota bacterium]